MSYKEFSYAPNTTYSQNYNFPQLAVVCICDLALHCITGTDRNTTHTEVCPYEQCGRCKSNNIGWWVHYACKCGYDSVNYMSR